MFFRSTSKALTKALQDMTKKEREDLKEVLIIILVLDIAFLIGLYYWR